VKSRLSISSTVSSAARRAPAQVLILELAKMLRQRAGVDADRRGVPRCLARAITSATFSATDVAGSGDTVRARFDRLERQRVLKWMSAITGSATAPRSPQGPERPAPAYRDTHEVAPRRLGADLVHRRLKVRGLGLGHRLDDHGSAPPIRTPPIYLPLRGHRLILDAGIYSTARARCRASRAGREPRRESRHRRSSR